MPKPDPTLAEWQAVRIKALEETLKHLLDVNEAQAAENARLTAQVHALLDKRPVTIMPTPEPTPGARSTTLERLAPERRLPFGLRSEDLLRKLAK